MATIRFDDPNKFSGFVDNANTVLDAVKEKVVPSALFRNCSGAILISAWEVGAVMSGQSGSGVAMSHDSKTGTWSAPLAVGLSGVGAGAVFGYAEKQVLILLGPKGMEKLLTGNGQLKVGCDLGFVDGKHAAQAGADWAISDKGGFASSLVFTFSKGCLLSIEVEACLIDTHKNANKAFYGTDDSKAILDGKGTIPGGDKLVSGLHARMKEKEGTTTEDEVAAPKKSEPGLETATVSEEMEMEA